MTDVVERLRECASPLLMDMYMAKMVEAAIAKLRDEIERLKALSQNNALSWDAIVRERNELRAEIERLLAVLRCISQLDDDGEAPGLARAALEPKP
jgi:uncharacterized small protein (DUF1192 family)